MRKGVIGGMAMGWCGDRTGLVKSGDFFLFLRSEKRRTHLFTYSRRHIGACAEITSLPSPLSTYRTHHCALILHDYSKQVRSPRHFVVLIKRFFASFFLKKRRSGQAAIRLSWLICDQITPGGRRYLLK